jgi:hypothetical protein
MSFAVGIEADIVRVSMYGILTRQDLTDLLAASDAIDRRHDRIPPRLTDLRGVTEFQVSFAQLSGLAAARTAARFPNAFRSALLVSSPAQLGMANMYRTLNDNPQISIEVFEDEAAALAWLRNSPH